MPPPPPRVELDLPQDELFVLPRAGLAPSVSSLPTTAMPAPSWTASYSATTRRPLTAADAPSSPAPSSTASQKFEVKRLLSRPADPIPSPRPLTTFDTTTSTSLAGPSLPGVTVKRSNSASRFLKRRPSKGHLIVDPPAPSEPLPLPDFSSRAPRYAPPSPYSPPTASSETSIPTLTPASAYALAYARRTNMTTQPSPSPSRPRHPFEDVVGTGRVVALGDPADDSITLPVLSLAGFGPAPAAPVEKEKEKECGGAISLTRKVSARFGKRRRAGTNAATVVQSDAEAEDWSREKERVGMRAVGMSPAAVARLVVADQSPSANRNRMSRHLSIEDFSHLVQEGGIRFEMETGVSGREKEKGKNRGSVEKERMVRTRLDSTIRREDSRTRLDDSRLRRDDSRSRRDDLGSRRDDSRTRREMPGRSASTPNQGSVESRSTGTVSPENTKAGGGMLWRLVKKMSTGTLKEKRSSQSEKVPPVPPLPSTLPSSRRSSIDYGEEVRPELTQFRTGSTNSAHSSRPNTIHQSSTDLSHHHRSRLTLVEPTRPSPSRPSMSHTNDSSVLSSSPKSSFGRTQSPRTSISSYVDVGDDMPPPLPLSVGMQPVASTVTIKQPTLVGKHIVSPGELAQYHQQAFPSVRDLNVNPSPSLSSPSLPPPKRPRKPRDKTPLPASPMPKSKPNLLRRPTIRVDDETGSSSRARSPRSASMGLPSPRSANSQAQSRSRSRTQSEAHPPSPRPRSSSMGTVFTFRELGEKKKLSEQEKVDKFEQLLEASDKAGGTLHARLQERMLLSDSMRMSDAGSVRSGM